MTATKRRIIIIIFIVFLALGLTAFLAADRYLIQHVEIADVSAYSKSTVGVLTSEAETAPTETGQAQASPTKSSQAEASLAGQPWKAARRPPLSPRMTGITPAIVFQFQSKRLPPAAAIIR